MAPVYDFDITSIEFLLFNNESGACSRLNKLTVNDSGGMGDEFELIDRIIRSTELKVTPDFIKIAEKFMDWGAKFIVKIIQNNIHINYANKIISHIDHLYGLLPNNSDYTKKSFLSKETVMSLFKQMEQNFNKNHRNYLDLFSKIWILCEIEIKDSVVFSTALNIVYELLKCTQINDLIVDIFNCAENMLSLHVLKLNDKISEKLVINALLNILKVVVRSEQHAFARINFWWKFICSLNAQVVCSVLFAPCVIPFLANLFGKYLSFDLDEKFQYSLYTYNCFNYYEELGPLCNHVMTQILRLVGEPYLSQMEKSSKYDTIKHWRPFTDFLLVKANTSVLFISFYYWCQTAQLNKAKSAPTPFFILETVFKSFSGRFLKPCLIKQRNLCRVETEDDNVIPLLYEIIDQALSIKRRLEIDLKNSDRSVTVVFSENLRLMKAIIDSFKVLGDNTSFIPCGLKLMLRVLNEHLGEMGEFGRTGDPGRKWCRTWLDASIRLIDRVFPKNSLAFTLLMYDDVAAINSRWFHGWLQRARVHDTPDQLILGEHCSVTSLQCWYYLTVKLCPRLDKDSFTVYSSTECHPVPFTEYLVLPVFLVTQLGADVLTADDYQGLWKMWDHIYIDLVAKAQLLGSSVSQQWSQAMVAGLRPILETVRANRKSATERPLLLSFNFVCRCLRLVVLRADDCVEDDVWTRSLHALLIELSSCFSEFSVDHLRIQFGGSEVDSGSSDATDQSDVLIDLVPVPVGNAKWPKTRLGYVSRFQCDLDSNLDTFLSLLNVVICKLAHDEATMLKILDLIGDKLAPLTMMLVAHKKSDSSHCIDLSNPKITRSRIAYDENMSQLENFLSHLLTRIQFTCFRKTVSSEAVAKVTPVLVYIFRTESWVLSRSTVQFAVQLWNDIVAVSNAQSQPGVTYPDELVRVVFQMKVHNKAIEIPESIQSLFTHFEIPMNLVHEDSFELPTQPKPVPHGSILHKLQTQPNSPIKFIDSIIADDFSNIDMDSQTSLSQIITPTKPSPAKSPITNKSIASNITPKKSSQIYKTPTKGSPMNKRQLNSSPIIGAQVKSSIINKTDTNSPLTNNTLTKSSIINSAPHKSNNTPTKSSTINITPNKSSPISKIKEFSSPTFDIPRRVTRKRSYFDLTRKSSDADYVVIAPQTDQKRARLTEHQKERFEENRDQYKPSISTELGCNVPPLCSLFHQDSVASNETVVLPSMSDSTDIDLVDNDRYVDLDVEIATGVNDAVGKHIDDAISIALSSDSEESQQRQQLQEEPQQRQQLQEEPQQQHQLVPDSENKENINQSQLAPPPISDESGEKIGPKLESTMMAMEESCAAGDELGEESSGSRTQRDKIPFVDLTKNNAAKQSVARIAGPTIRLSSGRLIPAPFPASPMRGAAIASAAGSPLLNRPTAALSPAAVGLGRSPINSMMRSKRCVQMVRDSQKKDASLAQSPVTIPVSAKAVKQTGIIRHMLSERKKDVRVSFSIPEETEPLEIQAIKVENETSFLSPIPERAREFSTMTPDQLCINLNNSLIGDSRHGNVSLLEETRQSLSEIVRDFSPIRAPNDGVTFEESFSQIKNIMRHELDDNKKKEMIKSMLEFTMSELNNYL